MSLLIGVLAKLYFLDDTRVSWGDEGADGIASGVAPEGLVEILDVKDLEIPVEKEKADVTTRRSRYKATKGTLRGVSIDIPMEYNVDATDGGLAALQKAFL